MFCSPSNWIRFLESSKTLIQPISHLQIKSSFSSENHIRYNKQALRGRCSLKAHPLVQCLIPTCLYFEKIYLIRIMINILNREACIHKIAAYLYSFVLYHFSESNNKCISLELRKPKLQGMKVFVKHRWVKMLTKFWPKLK